MPRRSNQGFRWDPEVAVEGTDLVGDKVDGVRTYRAVAPE